MPEDSPILTIAVNAAERLLDDLSSAEESQPWDDSDRAFSLVASALQNCLDRLAQTNCWGEASRPASNEFWKIAGDRLRVGELQLHARTKPRGYAGDFELLHKICTNYRCDHPLGRLFDRFFQEQAAPQAVRNRTAIVADGICVALQKAGTTNRIVSIGSGPAADLSQTLDQLSSSTLRGAELFLLDIDPNALDFARAQLEPRLRGAKLELLQQNLFRIARRKQAAWSGASIISCVGLFDYLEDDDAAVLLKAMWSWLAPGGTLLAFNFSPNNPSRAYMEWIGNWYLIYRSREELAKLAAIAELPGECFEIAAEPLGVNLYLRAEKPQ